MPGVRARVRWDRGWEEGEWRDGRAAASLRRDVAVRGTGRASGGDLAKRELFPTSPSLPWVREDARYRLGSPGLCRGVPTLSKAAGWRQREGKQEKG